MGSLRIGLGVSQAARVAVLGNAVVGSTLSLSPLPLNGAGPFNITVQWLRDGAPIGGANDATYTTVAGDVGTAISAEVTINSTTIPSDNAVTIQAAPVAPTPPAWTVQPSFTDLAPQVGATVTVDPGSLDGTAPITIEFEYLRLDGVDKTPETVGLSWDSTGETAGVITARLRATNAAGSVLSDEVTVNLAAASVGGTDPNVQSVAADGWQVTYDGAQIPAEFDPVADPKVVTVQRSGFDASGAAATVEDELLILKRVRQPFPAETTLTADQASLDDFVFSGDVIAGVTNA
ncbi:MAG: hypothetical protein AAGI03_01790, partial [Pseudomonadota bacterium]